MANGGKVVVKVDGDTKGFESKANKLKTGASGLFQGIGKAALAAGVATGAAILAVGKEAVISAYGDYEQLTGGVETLFKESSNVVMEYVKNAYQTAGLSANQYMETITGFSASLLQSLGGDTAKAAEYGNQAVVDMADNANKMGTNIQRIQDAYQGFAKQNYTMLDNLKLGYGGTKTEMERLLADAEAIKEKYGETASYSVDSFADIVEAIHVVQSEMGITGTTALEAATTIQGSLAMTKASWKNLMTGLSDPSQDFDMLMNQFMTSVETLGKNLMPRVTNILQGIAQMISVLAPEAIQAVSAIFPQLLPAVSQGMQSIVLAIVSAIPQLGEAIISVAPMLMENLIHTFNSIVEALPAMITMICEALPTLIPLLINGIVAMVVTLIANLPAMIQPVIDNLPDILVSIVDALISNLPILIQGIVQLNVALVAALPQILAALGEALVRIFVSMFTAAWEGIKNVFAYVDEYFGTNFSAALEAVEVVWDIAVAYFKLIWEGIKAVFSVVATYIGGMFRTAFAVIKAVWDTVTGYFQAVWDTIAGVFAVVRAVLSGDFQGAWEAIKGIVGTWSAYFSGVWESIQSIFAAVGSWFGSTFQAGEQAIKSAFSAIGDFFKSVWESIKNAFHIDDMFQIGSNIIQGLWNGISSRIAWVVDMCKSAVGRIKDAFTGLSGFVIHSPSRWAYRVGAYVVEGFGDGISAKADYAVAAVGSLTAEVKTEVEKTGEEIAKSANDITATFTEEEKKLFEATQKDIETNKKNIQNTFKEITAAAFDSVEEISKAQKNLEEKIKGYGTLVADIKISDVFGGEKTVTRLGDLQAQNAALEEYEKTLLAIRDKGVPKEFFAVIRDMDLDEAMKFAKLLLSATDEEFEKFIRDWEAQQATAARIAKNFYREEAEELAGSLSDEFSQTPEAFFDLGAESIKQFGEGFMESLAGVMETVRAGLQASLADIMPGDVSPAFAWAAPVQAGNTYNFYSSKSTVTEQLAAAKNQDTLKRMRGV